MGTLGKNTVTSPEGDSIPKCQCHLPSDRLHQAAATKETSALGCLNGLPVCLFTEIKCHSVMRMDLSSPICRLWPNYKMAGGTWMVTAEDCLCVSHRKQLNMIALRELKRKGLKSNGTN